MRVRVYYNLHKSVWSVQEYVKGKGWRLLCHVDWIHLAGVEWIVYAAGRERVVREQRKNVHAYGVGHVVAMGEAYWKNGNRRVFTNWPNGQHAPQPDIDGWDIAYYNPYTCLQFRRIEASTKDRALHESREALFQTKDGHRSVRVPA